MGCLRPKSSNTYEFYLMQAIPIKNCYFFLLLIQSVKLLVNLDERALIDQVEGALDEIVAAADLILLAELDEFPDESTNNNLKNDKSNKTTKENDSSKEDLDSIREFDSAFTFSE